MATVPQPKNPRQAKERKYGKNRSYPIPVWNGILEHCDRIGTAIWEFLWCLDKVTEEDEHGVGWCLGKTPIDSTRIARELKEHPNTAYANLERLERFGYLVRPRTPRGYLIGVRNSRKFDAFRRQNEPKSDRQDVADHPKSDSQKTVNQSGGDSQKTGGVIHNFLECDSQETVNASLSTQQRHNKKTNSKERGANAAPRDLSIAIPEWIPTQPWAAFLKFRAELKKPMSAYQQELAIKKLDKFRSENQNLAAVLEQSIVNGWISIWPVNAKRLDSNTRVLTDDERLGLSRFGYGKTTADENARTVRYAEQLFKTLEEGTYDALKKELLAHGETFDCERVRALIRAIPKTNWPDVLKKTGE